MPDMPSFSYCLSIYWLELFHFNDQGNGIWDSDWASPDLRSELPSQLAFGLIASNTERSWFPQNFAEDRPAGNWLGTIKLHLFVFFMFSFFFPSEIFRLRLIEAHLFELCLWSKKIDWYWLGSTLKYFWPTFIHLNLLWLVIWVIIEYFKKK